MRLKLVFQKIHGALLPLNYKYELSSWIYKVLYTGNEEFSNWLHQEGYSFQTRRFKLFTFSNLYGFDFRIENDRLRILSDEVTLIVSFKIDEAVQHFVEGLFKDQHVGIGDKLSRVDFNVKTVEKLKEPVFHDSMQFRTLSPLIISKGKVEQGKLKAKYLGPDEESFGQRLLDNLQKKKAAILINGGPEKIEINNTPFKFELIGSARRKKIRIKVNTPQQSDLIGYEFKFKINATPDLLKLGYEAGFGEKNSLGFGCVELVP